MKKQQAFKNKEIKTNGIKIHNKENLKIQDIKLTLENNLAPIRLVIGRIIYRLNLKKFILVIQLSNNKIKF